MHYVVGFQFNEDGNRVALIKKNRPSAQVGLWNGIGGGVERGQTPREAMVCEFAQETGVTQMGIVWRPFMTLRTWTDNLVSYFASFTDQVELVSTVTDELVSVHQVSVLPAMVDRLVPDVPWQIVMALSVVGIARTGADGRRQSCMYAVTELPPPIQGMINQ